MRIAICDDEKNYLEDIIKHIDFFSKDNNIEMQKNVFTSGEELIACKNKFCKSITQSKAERTEE